MNTSTSTNAPADANPYADFQAGVTAALRSWSALREAVQQTWGGNDSAAKAEDLRAHIFAVFDGTSPNPKMSLEELEDNLLGYMEDEFGVVLEDESEREVAALICRMYDACAKGEVTLAREVVQNAIKAEEALQRSDFKSVIQSGEDGDDDMDDDCAEGDAAPHDMGGESGEGQQPTNNDMASSYASELLFGGPLKPKPELPPPRQLGVPDPETPPPVVDDDGFAMVTTKSKGKRR
jgi:pre-rRNA-processing protein TSR2